PQNPVGGGVGKYDKVELRIGTKNNRNYSKRKSMIYRDLTIDGLELIVGAENIFDEEPPFSNKETEGYDFSTHDPRGRFIYGRVNWRF
ncbi:hypothetical protein, partial [Thiolapillus sp.]